MYIGNPLGRILALSGGGDAVIPFSDYGFFFGSRTCTLLSLVFKEMWNGRNGYYYC